MIDTKLKNSIIVFCNYLKKYLDNNNIQYPYYYKFHDIIKSLNGSIGFTQEETYSIKTSNGFKIYLNTSYGDTSFAAFKELGNILIKNGYLIDSSWDQIKPGEKISGYNLNEESYLNEFAAEMLMPSDDIENYMHKNYHNGDILDLECISKEFQVPESLMRFRLCKLGYILF